MMAPAQARKFELRPQQQAVKSCSNIGHAASGSPVAEPTQKHTCPLSRRYNVGKKRHFTRSCIEHQLEGNTLLLSANRSSGMHNMQGAACLISILSLPPPTMPPFCTGLPREPLLRKAGGDDNMSPRPGHSRGFSPALCQQHFETFRLF